MKQKNPFYSLDPELRKQYNLLAMRADKRLQRLEKYSKRPGNETLLKGAYARALRDIEVYSGKGHKRFKTTNITSNEELQAKINDIKNFLRADTSTLKPGIDTRGFNVSSYQKMADTFNKRYDSDLTWQDIQNYYGSKKAQRIASKIKASKSVAKALGEFKRLSQKNPKLTGAQLRRDIKANPNIRLSDDDVTNDIMKKMIKYGLSPKTLFKG